MENTAKERLKALRKEAYRKAKEKRDSDPRYLEMKKKQKELRKKAYQQKKEAVKAAKEKQKLQAKKAADQNLTELLKKGSEIVQTETT